MPICWRILSISVLGLVISVPSKEIEPEVGVSSRFRHRRKVDLPEPEGPMMTTFSPCSMCSEMSSSTRFLPKALVRWLTSITLTQPPFHLRKDDGEHLGDTEVGHSDDQQGAESVEGLALDGGVH